MDSLQQLAQQDRARRRLLVDAAGEQQTVAIWAILRVLTILWAAYVSSLVALTARERAIAVWPPSAPPGAWLERVMLAPFERRDTLYYLMIVGRGYRSDDGTAQFHPLLAWLTTPFAWLTGQPLLGLMLVSSVAGLACLLAFRRLAALDLEPGATQQATLLLCFSPLAMVFFIPYTEPLFLLWGVLCLLWARQGRWWAAGLAGGLAVLTRQQGLFLAVPLAWELWESAGRSPRQSLRAWRDWFALGLIPGGLLVWLVYRAIALGDLHADLSDPQALIYSLLISPSASKVVPFQAFLPPWQALWLALAKFWNAPEYSLMIDLILGFGFIALTVAAWKYMRWSYRLYSLVIILVSFAYYTGPYFPYMGLARHLLLAFPVFIGLSTFFTRRIPFLLMISLGIAGMFFLLLQYVIEGWVP